MKQTAVEFLQESLSIHFSFDDKMKFEGLFQQAKEMEKQQMIKFADDYEEYSCQKTSNNRFKQVKTAGEYYTKNYKK